MNKKKKKTQQFQLFKMISKKKEKKKQYRRKLLHLIMISYGMIWDLAIKWYTHTHTRANGQIEQIERVASKSHNRTCCCCYLLEIISQSIQIPIPTSKYRNWNMHVYKIETLAEWIIFSLQWKGIKLEKLLHYSPIFFFPRSSLVDHLLCMF